LDLNHSDTILHSTSLPLEYPLINQSLSIGEKKNVFLIKDTKITDSLYGGNICLDYYPYYSCISTKGNVLDIWFEGRAGCTTLYINWTAFPENFKDMDLYKNSPLFLVQEQRPDPSGSITNWKEISAVVPLALFQENRSTNVKNYSYNYSVFYMKNQGIPSDSQISSLMDTAYHASTAYIFDNLGTFNLPNHIKRSTQDMTYLNFWKNYSSLILIDRNNANSAVIGSLLAAFVNTPLVFIDQSNLEMYKSIIVWKQIFIIRHSLLVPALDADTYDFVTRYSSRYQEIYESTLQSEGSVYTFAKLYSTMFIQ
jgi:hypothetical protein